jgi:hypothetical protein
MSRISTSENILAGLPRDHSEGAPPMKTANDRLTQAQRDALWKWRWLGWRHSTPAFKASMTLLALLALALGVVALR